MRVGGFYSPVDCGIAVDELACTLEERGLGRCMCRAEALLEAPDKSRDEILRLLDDYAPLAA